MQTIRNNAKDLAWFTINVIATSTGTESKQFHYKMKRYKDESSFLSQLQWLNVVYSLYFMAWMLALNERVFILIFQNKETRESNIK